MIVCKIYHSETSTSFETVYTAAPTKRHMTSVFQALAFQQNKKATLSTHVEQ